MIKQVKGMLRYVRDAASEWLVMRLLKIRVRNSSIPSVDGFDEKIFKIRVQKFLDSMQCDESGVRYRYSKSCTLPTLYGSVYACMTYSMLGVLEELSESKKNEWVDYFDSFQREQDGLFYDSVVMNDIYSDSDWWGARHLSLHMISAYTALGSRPLHPFKFLEPYYDRDYINVWLDCFDWNDGSLLLSDVDNKIMNIGALLQYQRDHWADEKAAAAVENLKEALLDKINYETGFWGGGDVEDPRQRSRIVQFAYHLFSLYFYDGSFGFSCDKIVGATLKTQNVMGGYGVKVNSSACEDIDSIDVLIRLYPYVSNQKRDDILRSICRAFDWVLMNQVDDGGFVFRLEEPFVYGNDETSSLRNDGAMLATWFRVLSIVYMVRFLKGNQAFTLTSCPGYEFK